MTVFVDVMMHVSVMHLQIDHPLAVFGMTSFLFLHLLTVYAIECFLVCLAVTWTFLACIYPSNRQHCRHFSHVGRLEKLSDTTHGRAGSLVCPWMRIDLVHLHKVLIRPDNGGAAVRVHTVAFQHFTNRLLCKKLLLETLLLALR